LSHVFIKATSARLCLLTLTMLAMVAHFAVASAKLIAIAGLGVVSATTVADGANETSWVYSTVPLVTGSTGMISRSLNGNCAGPQMRCGRYSVGLTPETGVAALREGGRRSSVPKAELRVRTPFAKARKLVSLRS
jgi:hypothetical protein